MKKILSLLALLPISVSLAIPIMVNDNHDVKNNEIIELNPYNKIETKNLEIYGRPPFQIPGQHADWTSFISPFGTNVEIKQTVSPNSNYATEVTVEITNQENDIFDVIYYPGSFQYYIAGNYLTHYASDSFNVNTENGAFTFETQQDGYQMFSITNRRTLDIDYAYAHIQSGRFSPKYKYNLHLSESNNNPLVKNEIKDLQNKYKWFAYPATDGKFDLVIDFREPSIHYGGRDHSKGSRSGENYNLYNWLIEPENNFELTWNIPSPQEMNGLDYHVLLDTVSVDEVNSQPENWEYSYTKITEMNSFNRKKADLSGVYSTNPGQGEKKLHFNESDGYTKIEIEEIIDVKEGDVFTYKDENLFQRAELIIENDINNDGDFNDKDEKIIMLPSEATARIKGETNIHDSISKEAGIYETWTDTGYNYIPLAFRNSNSKLTTGAIVGITVGSVVAVSLILAGTYYLISVKRK